MIFSLSLLCIAVFLPCWASCFTLHWERYHVISMVILLHMSADRVFVYHKDISTSSNVSPTLSVTACVLFLSGWFCVSAAWNSQPFDLDNYTNANCLCPATSTGGRCQVGFYCPLGSSEPMPCPPGTFCNISGIWRLIIRNIMVHTSHINIYNLIYNL